MALYRALMGFTYPATKRDYDKARAGSMDAKWAQHDVDDPPFAVPYPAILASWTANGCVEEVKKNG